MTVIRLFENCFITKGASRSLMVDMQRETYYLIPNSLANLLNDQHILDLSSIDISDDHTSVMKEYADFIIGNELGFYCSTDMVQNFPVIDIQQWDYPATITNAIIEVNTRNFERHYLIMQELTDKFLTRHIEVNIKEPTDCETLENILDRLDLLDLYSYNIVCSFHDPSEIESAIHIIQGRHKVFRGIIHTTGKNTIWESDKGGWGNIFLITDAFSYKSCGIVDTLHFCTTIEHISESQKHNTCLNRKIMIDENGYIKNCPGFENNFGNINDTQLLTVINDPTYNRYWKITKDEIAVCKDCEFRHVCTDCRAFREKPEDIYSKPLKCGYDPYTNVWEEWSTNPLKQSGIRHFQI